MSQFNNVSVVSKANVYFDGKCVSHSITLEDGSKKSLGVILPATLTFNAGAPEIMESVAGSCRVKLAGEHEWTSYSAGESFKVPAHSSFDIEVVSEPYHYVCHYG
ncbi:MAG: pyrimidine/purine nucleoside phosphorylase [Sulfuriferula multivorans]|uniref:Pyrimidine/purine nucleoside phosphorylase n=1 Tax=Sulfuriferula multivorans TaxID=1559896 RepID=A0A7C9P9L7_9PROT|nr:pyrimidine/purine nucleoside phosphorylase [Sulfuriferula multivorans]